MKRAKCQACGDCCAPSQRALDSEKRLKAEVRAGLAREKNLRASFVALTRERDAMLNMLEHIEWYDGTIPPESRNGLRHLVGLSPLPALKPTRKRR